MNFLESTILLLIIKTNPKKAKFWHFHNLYLHLYIYMPSRNIDALWGQKWNSEQIFALCLNFQKMVLEI